MRNFIVITVSILVLIFSSFSHAFIHDSVDEINAKLGKKFKKLTAVKLTDETRFYKRPNYNLYISFKNGKVCSVTYSKSNSHEFFTKKEAFELFHKESTDVEWEVRTSINAQDFYKTVNGTLFGSFGKSAIYIHTREVDY